MPLTNDLVARAFEYDPVVLAGAAACLAVGCAACTAAYRLWLHPLAKVPGPKSMAVTDIFTWFSLFVGFDSSARAIELHRKYGPVVRVGPNRVMVKGDIAWSQVHGVRAGAGGVGEFGKTQGFLYPFDHMALLGAPYEDHRRQRRQMGHAFSAAALAEQEDIVVQYVDRFIDELKRRAQRGESIDIVAWINYCAFDIVGDLCFGESFHSLEGNTAFVDNAFIALEGKSYQRFWIKYPWLRLPMQLVMGTKQVDVAVVAGEANAALGARLAKARIAKGLRDDGRNDFATYMLKAGKDGKRALSDGEVEALSSILVMAGSETSATAMSGFVFLLTRPENADKLAVLVDEVRSAFANEADISINGTARLEYLHAVIEETMRIYPPAVTITPRVSPGAEVGGHWLPQGSLIHTYTPAAFRDPSNFKDPDSFLPERWLKPSHPRYDQRFESDRRDVFKPFSAGPRDCIGKNMAYAEMNVMAARLVYNFTFELLPGQEDWMKQRNTILWLKPGFQVRPKLHNKN